MPSRNEVAIAHLDNITETYAGSPVAKEAASLKRLLASANPKRETVQRHLQSFAKAAAKAGQPSTTKEMKTATKKTASKMATKSRSRMWATPKAKPAVKRYQTKIFKCWSDYQECCRDGDWRACASLLTICISKELAWVGPAAVAATKYFSGH
jgi:hypothetical protein